ncbi:MAG: helix-turn-helix transcriptional regulator [Acidimicrobiia bacterium]
MNRTYLPHTEEAVSILGLEIAAARRHQRWTAKELSERVGVTEKTLSRIEHGDLSVGIGIFFEAAVIVGIPLFGVEASELRRIMEQRQDRLAVLPAYVRGVGALDASF